MSRLRSVLLYIAMLSTVLVPTQSAFSSQDGKPSNASQEDFLMVRAIGSMPQSAAVKYLAERARPTLIDIAAHPEMATLTGKEAIEALCGSVQPGYLDALQQRPANQGKAVTLDGVVGADAYSIEWPACVHFERLKTKITYVARREDTLSKIRQRFVGDGRFVEARIDSFFALKGSHDHSVAEGEKLSIPEIAQPVLIYPDRISAADLTQAIETSYKEDIAVLNPVFPGNIIGPVVFAAVGTDVASNGSGLIQGTFRPCRAATKEEALRYPFDPAEVADAYWAARRNGISKAAEMPPNRVKVAVIDNGTFGSPCGPVECPERIDGLPKDSAIFPYRFFAEDYRKTSYFGPKLNNMPAPLNYDNLRADGGKFTAADLDPDNSHGTHVAGLILGGPGFFDQRTAFEYNALTPLPKPWLELSIGNIAGPRREIPLGNEKYIVNLVPSNTDIINMSIVFDGTRDVTTTPAVTDAINKFPQSLFIVAGGNDGISLATTEYYPAVSGGAGPGSLSNVLTVGAHDAAVNDAGSEISEFSNRDPNYVDILAPGCQILSWIDGDGRVKAISGTSQATPFVTFAATLLRSVWQVDPQRLKHRLIYSGDLLAKPADRALVRSHAKLNIAKALTFRWDRLTIKREGEPERTLLGLLKQLPRYLQCGTPVPQFQAIKRAHDGELYVYMVKTNGTLNICSAKQDWSEDIYFTPSFEIVNGRIAESGGIEGGIKSGDVREVVRAN